MHCEDLTIKQTAPSIGKDEYVLQRMLNKIITTVYKNENKFLNDLCPGFKNCELFEFYMASDRCKVLVLTWSGHTLTDTVKTVDVIDWFNSIQKDIAKARE